MNLTLYGRIPSKKNSVIISTRGGRVMRFPSHEYQAWHKVASGQIAEILHFKTPVIRGGKIKCSITIFAPDQRRADLSNKAESIMDLLVDNGIIEDDSWFVVEQLSLYFGGVDKISPRAEIEII